jgi:broad specificity phosphatase PhoE
MTKIWLVRHAQSKGQTAEENGPDPDLTDLGKYQAERLIQALKPIRADSILISPLKRAWRTFEISRTHARKIRFDSRLIESTDKPEGYSHILPVELPDIADSDTHDAWLWKSEDRAVSLIDDLLTREGKSIMLFGHCGIFGILCRVFMGVDPEQRGVGAHMDNTGISLLALKNDKRRIIEMWNDRAHVLDLLDSPYSFDPFSNRPIPKGV